MIYMYLFKKLQIITLTPENKFNMFIYLRYELKMHAKNMVD